jgi:hypothetical protein
MLDMGYRHGSVPHWVNPPAGKGKAALHETRDGRKIVRALQDEYAPVFGAYVNLKKQRQERLKEFEERIRAATKVARSKSPRTAQAYSTLYESEEKQAIKALRGLRRR